MYNKINYTNDELLHEYMKQIKDKTSDERQFKDIKKEEDLKFLRSLDRLNQLDDARKTFHKLNLKNEYMSGNEYIKR